MMRKSVPVIVSILIALGVTVSIFWYIQPSIEGPHIDDSWILLANLQDEHDTVSLLWIQETYGGTVLDLNDYPTVDEECNKFGQNLLVLGASEALAYQLPWVGFNTTWFGVIQPDTYPKVYVTMAEYGWTIHTPKTEYASNPENDIGYIAKGYDYGLRRWIVVIIGYSYWGSAYASKLACTRWNELVVTPSYLIYQVTEHGTSDPDTWTWQQFDGVILEYGA